MELAKNELRLIKNVERDMRWDKFVYILFGLTLGGNAVLFIIGVIKNVDFSLLCLWACWILFSILMLEVFYVKFRLFKITKKLMNELHVNID